MYLCVDLKGTHFIWLNNSVFTVVHFRFLFVCSRLCYEKLFRAICAVNVCELFFLSSCSLTQTQAEKLSNFEKEAP